MTTARTHRLTVLLTGIGLVGTAVGLVTFSWALATRGGRAPPAPRAAGPAAPERGAPPPAEAPAVVRSLEDGVVRVGGYVFPPFLEEKEGGGHAGAAVDLIAELNRLQDRWRFELVPKTAAGRYDDFRAGRFDMVLFENAAWGWAGMDVVASRIYLSGGEVYVAKRELGRDERYFSTLRGKRISAIRGYHYGFADSDADPAHLAERFFIRLSDSHRSNIEDVVEGRADVSVVTRSYLARFLKERPELREELLVSRRLDQAYNHTILVRRGLPISRAEVNGLLDRIEESGFLGRLRERLTPE